MTQWWYGHNAVGFFLTAGFLGMMYYFVPKQAERPVFSYKLSIMHFWALIFSTSGLVRTTCTTQHCLTGRDAWHGVLDHAVDALMGRHDQRSDDAVWRMGQAAHRSDHPHDGLSLGFYGMSTFEGPMMSIQAVNSPSATTLTGQSATCIPAPLVGSA